MGRTTPPPHEWGGGLSICYSLHGYGFGQVSWLVYVLAQLDSYVVGEQLQHHDVEDRGSRFLDRRHHEDVGRHSVERAIAFRHQREDRRVAGDDLVDVADHLVLGRARGAYGDDRKLLFQQGYGTVLQQAA